MQRRALVTGAAGFIGHHLVRRLVDEGWDVTAFIRYTSHGSRGLLDTLPSHYGGSYRPVFGDLRDSDAVRRAMHDRTTVFHLAALIGIPYSYVNPREVADVNVGGTLNVLEAGKALGTLERIVVTSTSEVYGTAQTAFIAESHPLNPQSPYAATKAGADHLALAYHRAFDLPVTICRPFNTFGPGQSARAIIPTIAVQALCRPRIELGSLTATRDLNYVDNTVDAFLALATSERAIGNTFHFGSGREISVAQLAEIIVRLLGKSGSVDIVSTVERTRPEKSEVYRLVATAAQAREVLGWRPRVALEDGLQHTLAWIQAHRERYHAEEYVV